MIIRCGRTNPSSRRSSPFRRFFKLSPKFIPIPANPTNRPMKRSRAATMIWPEKQRNRSFPSENPARNWLDLPPEVLSMILMKLNAVEILTSVQYVCSSWYKICKQPHLWRVIDMHSFDYLQHMERDFEGMCFAAVHRSRGQVVDIAIAFFGTDALLQYIALESNQQLKRLSIAGGDDISDEGLVEAVSKLPLLENLEISLCSISVESLRTIGRCCPILKTLELYENLGYGQQMGRDMEALAIAETMPKLRRLRIMGNTLTDRGLQAILNGCPELECLNLNRCFNLKFEGQLRQKCAERIKTLYMPL